MLDIFLLNFLKLVCRKAYGAKVLQCRSVFFSLSAVAAEVTAKLSGFLFATASIVVKESSTGFCWCSVKCSYVVVD